MHKKAMITLGLALYLGASGTLQAQENEATADMMRDAVSCADLNWSAQALSMNPDIARICTGVYEKDGRLFAKGTIEVLRVRGNRMTFRPLYADGGKGESRSVQLDPSWRAEIGGRKYRASELSRGQELNVYLPEDRFALAVADADGPDEMELVAIEEEVVEMPTTASPLFLIGLAGSGLLALGGILGRVRRRLS